MSNQKCANHKSLIFPMILVFIISLTMISCPAPLEVWTITFDSNGGSTVSDQQVSSIISKPNNPSKHGFVLEGWYSDEGLTQKWDFASDTEGDRTLFAKWVDDYSVIRSSDNAEFDAFGRDVAISENTAIVSDEEGGVYIFVRDGITWIQQQKLEVTNEDDVSRNFGYSVDISGNTAIVGVAAGSTNAGASGSASIFTREDGVWTLQQRITVDLSLPNGNPDMAQFGSAVAIEGDNVVVGAPYALIGSSYSGYAYVFERVDGVWSKKQRLKDSDPNSYCFGSGVDIWEDTIVIGSDYSSSTTPCKAIVFRTAESGWVQEDSFEISEYVTNDSRVAVAIAEDTVVLGSPSKDEGRVYVYTKNGDVWSQETILTASDGEDNDEFGASVDIDTNTILVGSWGGEADELNSGCAYRFHRSGTTWTQEEKIAPVGSFSGDRIGNAVALSYNTMIVGAKYDGFSADHTEAVNSGAAYIIGY